MGPGSLPQPFGVRRVKNPSPKGRDQGLGHRAKTIKENVFFPYALCREPPPLAKPFNFRPYLKD
jgi:hypothetical protein